MSRNLLVFIDRASIFFLFPLIILLKIKNFFFRKFFTNKSKKKLFIKFIGMGNFYNLHPLLSKKKVEILTLGENKKYFEISKNKNKTFILENNNFILLIFNIIICSIKLIFQKYDKIIIFENDSTLSKILASLPYSNKIVGISNTYKNIFNEYFFDKYFVSLPYIGKIRELNLLDNFKVSQNKLYTENLSQIKKLFIKKNFNEILKVKKISIYSECGDNAYERKLDVKFLKKTLSFLEKYNVKIQLVFSSNHTVEKNYFLKNVSKHKDVKLIITKSYNDYIKIIKNTDLIITSDSQTAHVAAFLNKLHIVIFGPSFPYEVSFTSKRMYPMSRLLECSPCTNRYFKTPCDDKFFCFDFNFKSEEIFKYLIKK